MAAGWSGVDGRGYGDVHFYMDSCLTDARHGAVAAFVSGPAAALASRHESLRLRPARLRREPRPYKAGRPKSCPYPLEQAALQGRRCGAHLRRASRRVGGARPPRLRRRPASTSTTARPTGLMNSPNLDGGLGRAAHEEIEAADLRQPAAAARPAAAGRRDRHARLPVERPADLEASRAASRASTKCTTCRWPTAPRALRGGVRHRPYARLDRGRVLVPGQVLVVQGRVDLAAPGAAPPSADLDPHRGQPRDRSSSRAGPFNIPITPGLGGPRRPARRHHPLSTPSAWAAAGYRRSRPIISSAASGAYVADSKAQAIREMSALSCLYFNRTLFGHGNFTETALQREAGYSTARILDRLCTAGEPARGVVAARGFPQHDHGRCRATWPRPCRGATPSDSGRSASSPRPMRRGRQTWCRSASIAAPCPRTCSSSRFAASTRSVLNGLRGYEVKRVPAAEGGSLRLPPPPPPPPKEAGEDSHPHGHREERR